MQKSIGFYWRIFSATFTLSAFTFGGGYVIISLMRETFVEKYHWIEENEMLDYVALAQSAPGAVAVNASILVGYRLAGILGALAAILGTIMPPLILLSIISMFYTQFKDNIYISAFMKGTSAGVAAVIGNVVYKMARGLFKEKSHYKLTIFILSFIATLFIGVDVRLIILCCGLFGLFYAYTTQTAKKVVK
jgi:chromate transporter